MPTSSSLSTWVAEIPSTIRAPSTRGLRTLLFTTDLLAIFLAYSLASALRLHTTMPWSALSPLVMTFFSVNLVCLYVVDLYQIDAHTPFWKKPLQALGAVFLAGCIIVIFSYLIGAVEYSGIRGRGVLIGAQLVFGMWAAVSRFFASKWVRKISSRSRWLVVGANGYLQSFVRDLSTSRLAGYFGLLTPEGADYPLELPAAINGGGDVALNYRREGTWGDLESLAGETWSGIVVCAGNNLSESLVEILMRMRLKGSRVVDLADFYEQTWYKVPVFYLQRSWFAMAQGFQLLHNPISLRLKRIFDVIGATVMLIFALPLIFLAMIAIRIESRGPAVFRQTRVGAGGRLFTLYKLRSMRRDAEKNGAQWAAVGDGRITRVGSFLRATRIDELPQLINVLRGDMSFIGPRPERPEFTSMLEREIPYYNLRHILRPGVTGWAQVMYPYGSSVEDAKEKLQFELYYIKNYSLLLDAAIILKTVRVVLFGQGR